MADRQQLLDALTRNAQVEDPERALEAGLAVLAARVGGGADELAGQLPEPYDGVARAGGQPEAPEQDDDELGQRVAQRLGVDDASGLDVLQGTMLAVAEVAGDRDVLRRLAAQLPAPLKPLWDPGDDADRFRTAQADEGDELRAGDPAGTNAKARGNPSI